MTWKILERHLSSMKSKMIRKYDVKSMWSDFDSVKWVWSDVFDSVKLPKVHIVDSVSGDIAIPAVCDVRLILH